MGTHQLPVHCQPSLHRSPLLPPTSLSADVPTPEVLERELAWLKEHLSQLDSPVVFCHNDLLCKNIIYDSTKGTASWLRRASVPRGPLGLGRTLMCGRDMEKETHPHLGEAVPKGTQSRLGASSVGLLPP